MTAAQIVLADFMSRLSEQHWSAGWLDELEYRLWAEMKKPAIITSDEAQVLSQLSDMCGGWVVWGPTETQETWIPMAEWEKRWAERYQ